MKRFSILIASALLALALGSIVCRAQASDLGVSWVNPVQNTDNSPIPATGAGSLASNRVEWGTCVAGSFGTKIADKVITPAATSTTITGLPPATYCLRAYATNTYGSESGASNVVAKLIPAPVPQPPVLSSTVTVVWDLKFSKPYRIVGNIPLGTPCGEFIVRSRGYSYYDIPLSAVELTRTPRSSRVVTKCEIG